MIENTNPKYKRIIFLRIFVVIMVLTLLFFGYVTILQPILGNPFIPYREYDGAEYFIPAVYQEFEKGKLFSAQYESYDFLNTCEIIDFYYADNKTSDNLLYGKQPDVYALTLDAGVNYESIAEEIRSVGTACGTHPYGDEIFSYYLMPSSGLVSDRFVFCLGDSQKFLRFILVTEIDEEDLIIGTGSGDVVSRQIIMETIIRMSTLDYKIGSDS